MSKKARAKQQQINCILEDRLSGLPDDILALILSWLKLREAARTSLLSCRWRNMWTLITGTMTFNRSDFSVKIPPIFVGPCEFDRQRFIAWVDKALDMHRASTIDGLKICYYVDGNNRKRSIDRWLTSALNKKVKMIELDFSVNASVPLPVYELTTKFLRGSKFDFLKIIRLNHVKVTGEVLAYVLSNCPLLEVLQVVRSKTLVELKVPCPLCNLKYLEIKLCTSMTCLDIFAPNLVSVSYSGKVLATFFKEVPPIVHLSIGGHHAFSLLENVNQFCSFTLTLESLVLDLTNGRNLEAGQGLNFPKFPMFLKLKHLKLKLLRQDIDLGIKVLQASLLLQRFTLQLHLPPLRNFGDHLGSRYEREALLKVLTDSGFVLSHLREIELAFFIGTEVEVLLLQTLVHCSPALEKVIVNPSLLRRDCDCENMKKSVMSRRYVQLFVRTCDCKYIQRDLVRAELRLRELLPHKVQLIADIAHLCSDEQ